MVEAQHELLNLITFEMEELLLARILAQLLLQEFTKMMQHIQKFEFLIEETKFESGLMIVHPWNINFGHFLIF